jgi:hypothetical protein
MAADVITGIGGVAGLGLASLRERWLDLHGSAAPVRMSREVLIQALAYRLQERAFGGLSPNALAMLDGRPTRRSEHRTRITHRIGPGTRFLREWQGRTVEVVADASNGFVYQGRTYRSLSAIAREVTGTRWSGPAFFGLRKETDRGPA